jgi:hypothetical protein
MRRFAPTRDVLSRCIRIWLDSLPSVKDASPPPHRGTGIALIAVGLSEELPKREARGGDADPTLYEGLIDGVYPKS